MKLLTWNDALKTHIDVIDQQHHGLVDLINATSTRLAAETTLGGSEVRQLLGYLKDYAEVHFSTEEALMALFGLAPDYMDRHHRNHASFLARVVEMVDDAGEGGAIDGQHVLAFLGDWLVRHIQGEDQRMAQRLHAVRLSVTRPAAETRPAQGAGRALLFADALAQGSADLLASETDVLALLAESEQAALVIALDANLMPASVMHATTAAANLLGSSVAALKSRSAASLFGSRESARFPVLMSEVLVSGHFEGPLQFVGPHADLIGAQTRVSLLVLQGQTVILVVFGAAVGLRLVGGRDVSPAAVPSAAERAQVPGDAEGGTVLSRHPLFSGLGRSELAGLESASSLVRLTKGQVLFHKGANPAGLYMVISGHVSLAVANSRDVEKVIGIFGAQQVIGEMQVFAGGPSPVTAQSLDPGVVLLIPTVALHQLLASSPAFAAAAIAYLGNRLHELVGEIEALSLHTAMERIIDHLFEHAAISSRGALEATLPAQKQIIASRLNLTPPTLSRAFQQLSEAGLIEVSGRCVTIPDREALLRYRVEYAGG
ncbi:MAG: bacteriohemerythrin [Azoarcus sp.]|nr:bacteriohemerythrin [Azoarcus sp.]